MGRRLMFEDFRSVPPLLAVLWTAIMFWGGLAWLIYAVITNNQLKVAKALEFGTSDFNNIPTASRINIEKVCQKRFCAPFKLWFKGLVYITIFGVIVFLTY